MPDGDKVHVNLAHRYQKVYKQICEGQYDNAALAHEVLVPLKRDLQSYGDEPFQLIQQVATELNQIPDEPLLKQLVNWGEARQEIDRFAQQTPGRLDAKELAVKACQQQLQELRYSGYSHDLTEAMNRKYVSAVYEANFEERVPLAQHYNGAVQTVVDARLKDMRIYVEQGINSFAAQMRRNGSVVSLRCPPMTRPSIDIDDNLFDLGK